MVKGSVGDGLVFHAGFPNAAEGQVGRGMSLDALVFKHRASTYLWRLEASIAEFGWAAGSVVVVDKALTPREGDIVVVIVEDSFVVRKLHQGRLYDATGQLELTETVSLWGVVTYVLHEYRSQ